MTQTVLEVYGSESAYLDGSCAGYRIGPYEGATDMVPNPHPQGTPEYENWERGFDDATDMLWNQWRYD